ncbi:hypothetical protein [Methylomonas koyamae]|uniref:hypothetical protein n=1 Tax=Methylomonas koyamae TaxID=702114 RepID=UPI002873F213|nr:hypothetical protein [Methylomonas koyamae]WNB76605.1 hypothetical protein RI210_03240 [Methylomonas koyamae]
MNKEIIKNTKIEWDGIFSLEIPSSWIFVEDDGVISIFDETNGVGVLQISFVKKDKYYKFSPKNIVVEFAENFLAQQSHNFKKEKLCEYLINDYPVSEMALIEEETEANFWLVWHIQGRLRVASITYNCLLVDRNSEQNICRSIISSFCWLDSNHQK